MQAASSTNPNALWLNGRGIWLGYILSVVFLHFLLQCVPIFSVAIVWTLTHLIHNLGNYIMFHHVKGTPYDTADQGAVRRLTHWEQIDNGEQFTTTRKFLTAVPVILFITAGFFTFHDPVLTGINVLSLLVAVVPKLPEMHKYRFLKINKY